MIEHWKSTFGTQYVSALHLVKVTVIRTTQLKINWRLYRTWRNCIVYTAFCFTSQRVVYFFLSNLWCIQISFKWCWIVMSSNFYDLYFSLFRYIGGWKISFCSAAVTMISNFSSVYIKSYFFIGNIYYCYIAYSNSKKLVPGFKQEPIQFYMLNIQLQISVVRQNL